MARSQEDPAGNTGPIEKRACHGSWIRGRWAPWLATHIVMCRRVSWTVRQPGNFFHWRGKAQGTAKRPPGSRHRVRKIETTVGARAKSGAGAVWSRDSSSRPDWPGPACNTAAAALIVRTTAKSVTALALHVDVSNTQPGAYVHQSDQWPARLAPGADRSPWSACFWGANGAVIIGPHEIAAVNPCVSAPDVSSLKTIFAPTRLRSTPGSSRLPGWLRGSPLRMLKHVYSGSPRIVRG